MLTQQEALDLKRRQASRILALPGVSGLGVEKDPDGFNIVVYLADEHARRRLPADLDGHTHKVVVTGPVNKQ